MRAKEQMAYSLSSSKSCVLSEEEVEARASLWFNEDGESQSSEDPEDRIFAGPKSHDFQPLALLKLEVFVRDIR